MARTRQARELLKVAGMSRLASSLLATLPAAVLATGCPEPTAERIGCPAGERCSPLTPEGLAVVSRSSSGDATMIATAVGGTQTFDLIDPSDGTPLAVPYRIGTTGPQVLAATDGAAVTFRALAAGPTLVRIDDPETGELHDTTTLRAEVATRATVRGLERPMDDRRVVWLAGATANAVIELADAAGAPLVDERVQIAWADDTGPFDRGSPWHTFRLPARDDSAALAVRAGQSRLEVTVERVRAFESIVGFVDQTDPQSTVVCFEARTGGAAVAGLDWRFEVAGLAAPSAGHPNCTAVPAAGPARTVVGRVGDASSALVVGQP
jgi:hypothetical protein